MHHVSLTEAVQSQSHEQEQRLSPPLSTAKVRALLAKSRIELGQYERGLTDCAVASRLLDVEERLLEEREAAQVPQSCPNGINAKSDSNGHFQHGRYEHGLKFRSTTRPSTLTHVLQLSRRWGRQDRQRGQRNMREDRERRRALQKLALGGR